MEKASELASLGATREVLDAFGLTAKYALGQNFLVNDDIIKKILTLADVHTGDFVLEVGPGIGTLTLGLLKRGAYVVAVERDPDLPAVLAQTCGAYRENFALISDDALDVSAGEMSDAFSRFGYQPNNAFKFVANLPYGVAATLILRFFETLPLASATVMVQKEVADRIAASPGTKNYGAYTVKLRLYAQVVDRFLVKPTNFYPQPHVDSSVIRLDRAVRMADDKPLSEEVRKAASLMADAAFASRRKTLANSCKTFFSGRKFDGRNVTSELPALFEQAEIDPKRRGETLDLNEFIRLGSALLTVTSVS